MEKILKELSSMELSGRMEATTEEKSQAAKFLGRLGGKKSAESRFKGMSKKERSELMRKVRLSPRENKEVVNGLKQMVKNMNTNM